MERELLRGDGMFLSGGGVAPDSTTTTGRDVERRSSSGVAASGAPGSGSLDGFLSHMMDNFGHAGSSSGSAAVPNSSRPPLAPSSAKRKREEFIAGAGKDDDWSAQGAPALSDNERRQAALLERQLYQELESGLLAGLFNPPPASVAEGAAAAVASSPDSNSIASKAVAGPGSSIRAASPNSMSIASALSLFAANCFHHYNNSITTAALVNGPATPLSSSHGGMVSPFAPNNPQQVEKGLDAVGAGGSSVLVGGIASTGCVLDTSTTSEESDESSQLGRPVHESVLCSSQLSSCSGGSVEEPRPDSFLGV